MLRLRLKLHIALLCVAFILAALQPAIAYSKEAPLVHLDWALSIWNQLDRQRGELNFEHANASLWVPDYYYFLGKSDAKLVMEEVWRNPKDPQLLGIIFPDGQTPFDSDAWAVILRYLPSGHVLDHEAADTDPDFLEQQLKRDIRELNQQRLELGGSAVEFLGWAQPPQYDSDLKVLFWPMALRFEGRAEPVLNYKVRRFGRVGTVELIFTGPMSAYKEIEDHLIEVVAMIEFEPGFRYNDVTLGLDRISKDDYWPSNPRDFDTGGRQSAWRVRLLQFLALPMLIIIVHQLYALFWRKPKASDKNL